MMKIRIADLNIEIRNIYPSTREYCKEYLLEESVSCDLSFEISEDDIRFERDRSKREDIAEGRDVREFSDAYLETLAVYRKIAESLPLYDTFLFHGSAVAAGGEGFLFTAASGTGKSTHTALWRELLGDRAVMVNDDKPLIRIGSDGSAVVYGTPWDGKHRISSNVSVPLKAVCILERAEENRIKRITKQEAYPMLMQQVYRPSDTDAMRRTLELIDSMDTDIYRLGCNMDISAAELSYETMKG